MAWRCLNFSLSLLDSFSFLITLLNLLFYAASVSWHDEKADGLLKNNIE
jgi:hypothetical protein